MCLQGKRARLGRGDGGVKGRSYFVLWEPCLRFVLLLVFGLFDFQQGFYNRLEGSNLRFG